MANDRIYLASPHMCGEEIKNIQEAFDTNWISPFGKNVTEFEREMCEYTGCKEAVALSSGTAAIHLALKYFGVGRGDVVFCSTLTFSGSCNAIYYLGAKAVFIDCDYETQNMSEAALKKAYEKYPNPKAIIIVNLYGIPANYEKLLAITSAHNTPVLEDAAESLGSTYKGIQTGNFGDISIFSFNGNKIVTTSGGGMAMVKDKKAKAKISFWATQSREKFPWYQHEEIGYNYRLSNICAGIGRGQLTCLNERIRQKRRIFEIYKQEFANNKYIEIYDEPENCFSNRWLSTITLTRDCKTTFLDLFNTLEENNIESRPFWKPMHLQPVFKGCGFFSSLESGSISEDLFNRSLCLTSDTKMTEEQVKRVAKIVNETVMKGNP